MQRDSGETARCLEHCCGLRSVRLSSVAGGAVGAPLTYDTPGDAGYDGGRGERERDEPVRVQVAAGVALPAGRRRRALRHLAARVPECAGIRPQLRRQQQPRKVTACREFMLGRAQRPPGNRQGGHANNKIPANRALRLRGTDAPDGRARVTSQRQKPCNQTGSWS
jgi:hypothetical protein